MTPVSHLLGLPHHDGSALYVPDGTPRLGDVVPVRFRVPAGYDEVELWVRTVRDGEPHLVQARLESADDHERWYSADLCVHNPVTSYRALLVVPGGYRWLNGRGVFDRDVPDSADFRLTVHDDAPAWLDAAVVYQIFPDRFARSSGYDRAPAGNLPGWAEPAAWSDPPIGEGPGASRQFYGGDLAGIQARLDHLQRLGVDTLYLTPVFPARSNHRYDANSFDQIDPLLGGDAALASLSDALHRRGMRLIGDMTTNHTGAGHDWFDRATADRTSPEAEYYYWQDDAPGYVGWLGHDSLPKLNYNATALQQRMYVGPDSIIGRGLREPFLLDGWRIDVANMTGRYAADDFTHEIARAIRRTMRAVNPDAVLVSEHFSDASADLLAGGWHANMNYAAFTKPLWTWLVAEPSTLGFLGLPVPVPRRDGHALVATMRDFDSSVPWKVTARQWNMLGSHDTPRVRTVVGSRAMVEVAAGVLFTYPGTPAMFAGDEGGLTGRNGEYARAPMPWDQIDAGGGSGWDSATFDIFARLIAMRRGSAALRHGGLRWAVVESDAVVFLRETADERVLVAVARDAWAGAALPRQLLPVGAVPEALYGDAPLGVVPEALLVPGSGPGVHVWRLA